MTHHDIELDAQTKADIELRALGLYLSGLTDNTDPQHVWEQLWGDQTSGTCRPEDEGNPDPEETWCFWEPFEYSEPGDIRELADIARDLFTGIAKRAVYRAQNGASA